MPQKDSWKGQANLRWTVNCCNRGGNDLKLFEVDQSVNKIRAEVDPEAELIFGAIQDEKLNGKMRVSIVATSLDGHRPESKTVLKHAATSSAPTATIFGTVLSKCHISLNKSFQTHSSINIQYLSRQQCIIQHSNATSIECNIGYNINCDRGR